MVYITCDNELEKKMVEKSDILTLFYERRFNIAYRLFIFGVVIIDIITERTEF